MARVIRCDHCRAEVSARGWHDAGWIEMAKHQPNGEPGSGCGPDCPDLEFCSWCCVGEYATARAILAAD